eukprot:TRINITY_DN64936_c0_g1_i1.p1 TRINITY_DN64936_c0_g1~~TRINITY_DN64936_c0_g1_i1.p1  ORF type:complete len:538 (+),score=140.56 TRINITY_DN64936_c0_g1_i1:104-1717(+)
MTTVLRARSLVFAASCAFLSAVSWQAALAAPSSSRHHRQDSHSAAGFSRLRSAFRSFWELLPWRTDDGVTEDTVPKEVCMHYDVARRKQVTSRTAAVRGLPPEASRKYEEAMAAAGSFSCLDGSGSVAAAAVNDEFCDCADGSDEPGTAACSGAPARCFYCHNELAVAKFVYASRVGDGICDCCDGSDEASNPGLCANTCEAEGVAAKLAWEQRKALLEDGLQLQKEMIANAQAQVKGWQQEEEALKVKVPELEAAEAQARSRRDELRKQVDKERPATPPGDAASKKQGKSQRDEDYWGDDEPAANAAVAAKTPADEKKQEVSEYAKWALEQDAGKATEASASAQAAAGQATSEGKPQATTTQHSAPKISEAARALAEAQVELDVATKAMREARQRKSAVEAMLLKQRNGNFGDDFRWTALADQCWEGTFSEYTYRICFFGDAKQGHTRLGSFEGWDPDEPLIMKFVNGQHCHGGPARSLRVRFACGPPGQGIQWLTEPSRCTYEAQVQHPAGCSAADTIELAEDQSAALVMPHDEL